MKAGLLIYGSLDTVSGGYLYDRKLVDSLREQGDSVEVISLPWRNYAAHLLDNIHFRLPKNLDILIQDELNHPSLILANRGKHPCPILSLVHHLRCSELRPAWQNAFYRLVEKKYLQSVDGFIFNSEITEKVVNSLIKSSRPAIVAYPPTDRFGEPISEREILERAKSPELRILFLGNVIYRKGLHSLLEAISSNQPSAFRLDVIGSLTFEPHYVKKLQKSIADNELSQYAVLHGSLDKESLIEKLRRAHVLVVPSSYEGYGIVYLEGMCFGLPAIGTTAGAAGEIIEHGKTGFLVAPNDSNTLANHLQSLAEDRGLLRRLSLNARERYLCQPTWTDTAKTIRSFLASFLQ